MAQPKAKTPANKASKTESSLVCMINVMFSGVRVMNVPVYEDVPYGGQQATHDELLRRCRANETDKIAALFSDKATVELWFPTEAKDDDKAVSVI